MLAAVILSPTFVNSQIFSDFISKFIKSLSMMNPRMIEIIIYSDWIEVWCVTLFKINLAKTKHKCFQLTFKNNCKIAIYII